MTDHQPAIQEISKPKDDMFVWPYVCWSGGSDDIEQALSKFRKQHGEPESILLLDGHLWLGPVRTIAGAAPEKGNGGKNRAPVQGRLL